MKRPKIYRTEVRSESDYSDIPAIVEFGIEESTAREIVRLAQSVKENGLYKVEKFDFRARYLQHDPKQDPKAVKDAGEENAVSVEGEVLNVSDTDFWFSAYIKHTDVEIHSRYQRIKDLAAYFVLDREPGQCPIQPPAIAIVVEGGVVQSVIIEGWKTDTPKPRFVLVDHDIEGADSDGLLTFSVGHDRCEAACHCLEPDVFESLSASLSPRALLNALDDSADRDH